MTKFKTYEEARLRGFKVDQSSFNQLSLARGFDNWTVAHQLASTGELSEEHITNDILKLSKNSGWTVAHELAYRNRLPERFYVPEILKLAKYSDAWTVAHQLAIRDSLPEKFTDYDILLLKSKYGYVYEHMHKYRELIIDSTKSILDLYLLAMTEYNYPKISFDQFNELNNKYGLGKMKQLVKLAGKV